MFPSLRRALLLAIAAAALAPAGAQADVTQSSVTSPANPTFRLVNEQNRKEAETLTVAGISDGTATNLVDIVCTRGGYLQALLANVPVRADGTFTAEVPLQSFEAAACVLRAVPYKYRGSELARYAGPTVSVTFYDAQDETTAVRATAGEVVSDYLVSTGHRHGAAGLRAAGTYSLTEFTGVRPDSLGLYGNETWVYGAALFGDNANRDRTAVEVDGRAAYIASSMPRFDYDGVGGAGYEAPTGYDGVQSTVSLDERTGRVTVTESERVLGCNRADTRAPEAVDCTSVLDTGLRFERTITFTDEHAIADILDRWTSTDGRPHGLRVEYFNEADDRNSPEWRFPGEARFERHEFQDTRIANGPGTILLRSDDAAVGALSFNPAPAYFHFTDYAYLPEVSELSVPAGGSAPVRRTFAVAADVAEAEALGRRTEDTYAAPEVSIGGPADGTTTGDQAVTVFGRATDNVAVARLEVNGQPVAVDAGGSFSARVPVTPGANRITVTAVDGAGLTAAAAIGVTAIASPPRAQPEPRPEPAGQCRVPRIKAGTTLKAVKAALAKAGCGPPRKTRRTRSAKVRKGRVVALTRKAGTVLPEGTAIGIKVSTGKSK